MLNWTSFRAFERGYVAEAPIRVIPRGGSAYKPKGYSSHPPNPLSILLVFCWDDRYRCPLLKRVADNDSSQGHQKRRCLPCRPTNSCGYRQGELSPYLVSR